MFRARVAIAVATILGALMGAGAAAADTDVPCDPAGLAAAFAAAGSGSGVINLATGCEYEVTSTLSLDSSDADVTVNGNGATIDGGLSVRVFDLSGGAGLTVKDATITGGSVATGAGGGIAVGSSSRLALERVRMQGNVAPNGGAIDVDGQVEVTDSVFQGNSAASGGGAIQVYGPGILSVARSAFLGNTSGSYAGAIYTMYGGTTTVADSTFHGNVSSSGGALYAYSAALELTNVTAVANDATSTYGGALNSGSGTLQVQNSLLAENLPAGDYNRDCYINGGDLSGSSNLTTSSNQLSQSSCHSTGFSVASTAELDLAAAPADNGGPTPTIALGPASRAALDPADSNCSDTDQRGFPRPSATDCSIGAYQLGSVVEIADATVIEGDSGTATLSFPVSMLPALAAETVTIEYEIDHVSTDGGDFDPEPVDGQLTLAPGETDGTVEVEVSGDTDVEPDETFTVTLTDAASTGAGPLGIGRAIATGTIVNDDFPPQTLTVEATGPGTVTSQPAGIECGPAAPSAGCEAEFPGGATVTLAATPDGGATFTGWSGCDTVASGDCVVQMTAAKQVSATFVSLTPGRADGIGDGAALAAAVAWANSNDRDDEITLAPDCVYDTGPVGALTVKPDDGHSLTVSGERSTIDADGEHVVLIAEEGSDLILHGVTIAGGHNPGSSYDTPGTDGYGGGLVIDGATVEVTDSAFVGNDTYEYGSGGAIFIFEGDLDITRSTFRDNASGWGGALDVEASEHLANATVTDSTFIGNEASQYGGAIDVYISSYWGGSGLVSVRGSTFRGNRADLDGGALDVTDGHLEVVNSTVQGNSSGQGGAALRVNSGGEDSAARIVNSTMVGNTTSGNANANVGVSGGNHVTIENSILAGGGAGRHSCRQSASGSGKLNVTDSLSDDAYCANHGFTVVSSLAELHLGPLADNGGPTETVALRSGSPAIDAGDQAVCDEELPADGTVLVDQRGWHRGQNPPNPCDIGAYEADRMRIGDASGTEGTDTQLTFPVTLDAPAPTDVTVRFSTRDGTAVAGTDYVSTAGELEFEQGDTSAQITVDLIDNDASGGQRELYVDLTDAVGAAAVAATGTGTITEDDLPGLTVSSAGAGTGKVTSADGFIECGEGDADCTHTYDPGDQVTLTAVPGPNSVFAGWSEGGCPGTGACDLTMDRSRSVVATFDRVQRQLTVATAGNGLGTVTSSPTGIECGDGATDCAASFDHGTAVTLTPTAAVGSTFAGWSGACSGTAACEVTLDQARTVEARFALELHQLTVTTDGDGDGRVTSSPPGIECGEGADRCGEPFAHGTVVELTPAPDQDSTFTGWSGACAGTDDCAVTMDQAREVTATFTLVPGALKTLSVQVEGQGKVTGPGIECGGGATGCSGTFRRGTTVTLVASPAADWRLAGFTVPCNQKGEACEVNMDQDRAVTASFVRIPPDNRLRVRNIIRNRRTGTGRMPVTLPGPGKVVLAGPKLKRVVRRVEAKATIRLQVRVRGKRNLRQLNRRGRIRPRLRVTYTPTGGTSRTRQRQVTLVKKPHRYRR